MLLSLLLWCYRCCRHVVVVVVVVVVVDTFKTYLLLFIIIKAFDCLRLKSLMNGSFSCKPACTRSSCFTKGSSWR